MKPLMNKNRVAWAWYLSRLPLLALLLLLAVAACQSGGEAEEMMMAQDAGHGHAAMATDEMQEMPHGPHGGRLLEDGAFALEICVDEAGRPPRWQVFPYLNNQPLPADDVSVTVMTERLDGERETFDLQTEAQALVSSSVLHEPHSFDLSVTAEHAGRRYHWSYPSYEGRTEIAESMAKAMNVAVAPVGPARLTETIDVLGRVDFAPGALVTLRAQFPGRVLEVTKNEGDRVKRNEVLAVIEANDSLRQYSVRATMDGMVIRRGTNAGDVVDQAALFVVGDARQLRVSFHVYPGDYSRIRPGQSVTIESVDGMLQAKTQISGYLPTTESATQTVIAYSALENPEELWLPGMTVTGHVAVADEEVPLAVRTDAIQRFRERPVVFAQVGETYEVRMLELGRQAGGWSEVLGGIKLGQAYVTNNSFLIKADIEKHGAAHDH